MKQQISVGEYDDNIHNHIPHYSQFHLEIVRLVKSRNSDVNNWLDTGCGTGNLVVYAKKYFPEIHFYLADPDHSMLLKAKDKFSEQNVTLLPECSTDEISTDVQFDVITAIMCHHYLTVEKKKSALKNCFSSLNRNGIFITFEHVRSETQEGLEIALSMMDDFHSSCGVTLAERQKFRERVHQTLFLITAGEYIALLKECGFRQVELFFRSHLQAGFYAIK